MEYLKMFLEVAVKTIGILIGLYVSGIIFITLNKIFKIFTKGK
jgi:hypothetical protein